MKHKFLTVTITGILTACGLTGFAQTDKKASEAREDIKEAQQDLKEAKIDSAADFNKFKKESEEKIAENQKEIAKLKAKKSDENAEANKKYNEKVSDLEKKNNSLKMRIEKSDDTKTTAWTSFKNEFNHDMSELGKSIKDIGVNNTN